MKFYFVDDDKNIRTILKILVTERNLGECCGSSGNGDDALEDVAALHPDIIIVDLLMPDMDGISFVEKARKSSPESACIMLSQVASKDLIAKAYESGIEFFIQKPLNAVEVESVIRNVLKTLSMHRTIGKVQSLFETEFSENGRQSDNPSPQSENSNTLYNFEQVRREMDYIRRKSDKHGNVKIRSFLNALLSYCENV